MRLSYLSLDSYTICSYSRSNLRSSFQLTRGMTLSFLLLVWIAFFPSMLQGHSEWEDSLLVYDDHAENKTNAQGYNMSDGTITMTHDVDSFVPTSTDHGGKHTFGQERSTSQTSLIRRGSGRKSPPAPDLTRASGVQAGCEIVNAIRSPHCKAEQCALRSDVFCVKVSEFGCRGSGLTYLTNRDVCRHCTCQLKLGALPMEFRIAKECEVTNLPGKTACRARDCAKQGGVFCTFSDDEGYKSCRAAGMRMSHNLDVCKGCRCDLKSRMHAYTHEDHQISKSKRRKYSEGAYSKKASKPTTTIMQRREIFDDCEIFHAFKSYECDPIGCGRAPFSNYEADVASANNRTPQLPPANRRRGKRRKRIKSIRRVEDSEMTSGSAPAQIQRRLVADGCEIYNALGGPPCNPLVCDQQRRFVICSRGPMSSSTHRRQSMGYGFSLSDYRYVCDGCRCRTPPPSRSRSRLRRRRWRWRRFPAPAEDKDKEGEGGSHSGRPKSEAEREGPASELNPLQRRLVEDGCEVYNPDGLETCDSDECGRQDGVLCQKSSDGRACIAYGLNWPIFKHVCGGCKCRTLLSAPRTSGYNRKRRRPPSPGGNTEGNDLQPKRYKVRQKFFLTRSEPSQIQRRLVADGCEVWNPDPVDFPMCKPTLCSQEEGISCYRPNGYQCAGSGFNFALYAKICKGCKCKSISLPWSERRYKKRSLPLLPGPEDKAKSKGSHPNRPRVKHLRHPESPLENGLQRRYVTHPCEISNPLHTDTCKPARCAAHPLVSCYPVGRGHGICRGKGLDDVMLQNICAGCWCNKKPPPKVPVMQNHGDMCEISDPENLPTCRPQACAAHPLVSCSPNYNFRRCQQRGMDDPRVQNICSGCLCALRLFPQDRIPMLRGRPPKGPAAAAERGERPVKSQADNPETGVEAASSKGSSGQELAFRYSLATRKSGANVWKGFKGLQPKLDIGKIVRSKSGRMKYSEKQKQIRVKLHRGSTEAWDTGA